MTRWYPTKGIRPNTSAEKVFVRLRGGIESKTPWKVSTTRWHYVGDDFDVMAYRAEVDEPKEEAA